MFYMLDILDIVDFILYLLLNAIPNSFCITLWLPCAYFTLIYLNKFSLFKEILHLNHSQFLDGIHHQMGVRVDTNICPFTAKRQARGFTGTILMSLWNDTTRDRTHDLLHSKHTHTHNYLSIKVVFFVFVRAISK